MHRDPLRRMLEAAGAELAPTGDERADGEGDAARVARVLGLLAGYERCFERDCWPGHVTASAWIVSHDASQFLLTHHRKLGRWLQLGGHADGDPNVVAVALREAREESGMHDFDFATDSNGQPRVLDVDVHAIPARGDDPEHFHHDVRFLLRAHPGQELAISEESNDLRWFGQGRVAELCAEASLARLALRAQQWLESGIDWQPAKS